MLATDRGKVGLSAYYVCDSREPVADEIVEKIFAPVWDANVGKGKLDFVGLVGAHHRR